MTCLESMHLKAKKLQLFWSLGHIENDFQEVTSSSLIKAKADATLMLTFLWHRKTAGS